MYPLFELRDPDPFILKLPLQYSVQELLDLKRLSQESETAVQ
jgi:hypothetical protein